MSFMIFVTRFTDPLGLEHWYVLVIFSALGTCPWCPVWVSSVSSSLMIGHDLGFSGPLVMLLATQYVFFRPIEVGRACRGPSSGTDSLTECVLWCLQGVRSRDSPRSRCGTCNGYSYGYSLSEMESEIFGASRHPSIKIRTDLLGLGDVVGAIPSVAQGWEWNDPLDSPDFRH